MFKITFNYKVIVQIIPHNHYDQIIIKENRIYAVLKDTL